MKNLTQSPQTISAHDLITETIIIEEPNQAENQEEEEETMLK